MIIGITGLIGSGKTTAAMHLVEKRGYWRHRFADPLKSMLVNLGLTRDEVDGDLKEQPCELLGGNTPRVAMQLLGTEWGRRVDPNIWVRSWVKWVNSCTNPNIVADDVRFHNETVAIKMLGGKLIKIERPGVKMGNHVSETVKLPFDHVIINDGSIGELIDKLEAVLD